MKPTVSVVVPLYNKRGYLGETIASIQAQTHQRWELVVVDNGSTDGGDGVVRALKDPRIRLLSSPKQGVSAARNIGYRHATGEWVVFLDADDLLHREYLESQLACSKNADLVVCSYVEFWDCNPNERQVRQAWSRHPSREAVVDSAIVYAPGSTNSFLIRRSFLRPELLWPEHLDRLLGEDVTFWFRLVNEARIRFNDRPLALYRIGVPGSRLTTLSEPEKLFFGMSDAVAENLQYLEIRGQAVNAGQAESLMRFYGDVFVKARAQDMADIRDKALCEVRRWQAQYFGLCQEPTFPMQIRRWLGLPLFARLVGHA